MNLYRKNKFKSIFLTSALVVSLFFTGCAQDNQNSVETQTQIKNSVSNENSYNAFNFSKEVPKDSVEALVERVVDGDTMKLKLKETGESITLRLLLVDTPESVKKGVDPQPYSIEASNYSKEILIAGDTVYIEYDEGSKTDKYNRHLGYLWFKSHEDNNWYMLNENLISNGYARVGYVYSQKRHLDDFYKAQDYAKSNKLNIWSVDGYVTDKGYDVDAYNLSKDSSSNTTIDFDTSNKEENSSNKVYANGGSSSSTKYHSSKDAHNMKGAIEMTENEAKSKGYSPCGLCY